jgi:hypothetical protein
MESLRRFSPYLAARLRANLATLHATSVTRGPRSEFRKTSMTGSESPLPGSVPGIMFPRGGAVSMSFLKASASTGSRLHACGRPRRDGRPGVRRSFDFLFQPGPRAQRHAVHS